MIQIYYLSFKLYLKFISSFSIPLLLCIKLIFALNQSMKASSIYSKLHLNLLTPNEAHLSFFLY